MDRSDSNVEGGGEMRTPAPGMKRAIVELERRVNAHDKILGTMKSSSKSAGDEESAGNSLKSKITDELNFYVEGLLKEQKLHYDRQLSLLKEENAKLQKQIAVIRSEQAIHTKQLKGHSKGIRAMQEGISNISRELNGDDDEPYL